MADIQEIRDQINLVRNATEQGENSKKRIADLLDSIVDIIQVSLFGGKIIYTLQDLDACGVPNVYPVNLVDGDHPVINTGHFALLVMRSDYSDDVTQIAFAYIGNGKYGIYMRSGEVESFGNWKQMVVN